MRVDVIPLYRQGTPIHRSERELGPKTRGVLRVCERRVQLFGRVTRCATLTSMTDGSGTALLPEMLDIELLWVEDGKLRMRGTELIDGRMYGQAWEMRLVA